MKLCIVFCSFLLFVPCSIKTSVGPSVLMLNYLLGVEVVEVLVE